MEKVRIYAVLEDVGSDYQVLSPTMISLKPFDDNCYFLDLEDSEQYGIWVNEFQLDCKPWAPYNAITQEYGWYDTNIEYFDDDEDNPILLDEEGYRKNGVVEATKCQKYEKGLPVGDPYYEY